MWAFDRRVTGLWRKTLENGIVFEDIHLWLGLVELNFGRLGRENFDFFVTFECEDILNFVTFLL